MKKSELLSHIEKETSLSSKTIGAVLAAFILQPRPKWNEAPVGYLPSAWHPWRFRRQLSLVSKPIVQLDTSDDPTFMIAPAMIVHHLSKFISDALHGHFDEAFFHKGGLLAKWIGHTTHERGEAFNERVAKRFRDNGWHAEANLSDGRILNRQKDPRFGDIDVLAWQPESGRVLVIECKDLSLDKTFGEIARRLAKYRGLASVDGKKRDELRRHLDRYEDLKRHESKLAEYVKCSITSLEAVLVFSGYTPMQFEKKIVELGVKTLSLDEISSEYGNVSNVLVST
jgi:hypothetical protein